MHLYVIRVLKILTPLALSIPSTRAGKRVHAMSVCARNHMRRPEPTVRMFGCEVARGMARKLARL